MPLFEFYQQLITSKEIEHDPSQAKIIERLGVLLSQIKKAESEASSLSFFKLFTQDESEKLRGIYIHGSVGRGKSMLMDLFYKALPIKGKHRVHFHEFMKDVHIRIKKSRSAKTANKEQLLSTVAEEIASKYKVICFDELQIHDIVDAMIVGKLFSEFLKHELVFVITSNRHPTDLYLDGLQREQFIPFINLILENFDIELLESPKDYRRHKFATLHQTFFHSNQDQDIKKIKSIYANFTNYAKPKPQEINLNGRVITFRDCYDDILWVDFSNLCAVPLASADYLTIAKKFNIIFLLNIPKMTIEDRNEAKRFTNLIDVLYDNNITFFCSANTSPDNLYPKGDGSFEFHRTASRLIEMQSDSYIQKSKGFTGENS